eukprot:942557-Amphidinium_carterae.1
MEENKRENMLMKNKDLSEERRQRSCTLYFLLASMRERRSLTKVMNCKPKEVFELCRLLAREYEPNIGSRSVSLLAQILQYRFDIGDFQSSLEKWANLIEHYDGTVARGIPKNSEHNPSKHLQEHLLATASRVKTYPDMRSETQQSLMTQKHIGG